MGARSEWPTYVLAAGLALLFGLGAADRWVMPLFAGEHPRDLAAGTVFARVAGEPLAAPAETLRFAEQRHGGELGRLDLYALWPTMAGYTAETRAAFDDVGADSRVIFLSVTPRDGPADMTARLGTIYARLFVGEPFAGPAGLIGRRLADGSGYEGEELFFEPGSTRPFVARCFGDDETPPLCIREIHAGAKLAVLYRFRKSLLSEWRGLDAAVRTLVEGGPKPI